MIIRGPIINQGETSRKSNAQPKLRNNSANVTITLKTSIR